MSEPKRNLSFQSPQELNDICHQLAMSMHYKNRVALGELGFVADLAEVIRRVGLAFRDGLDDPAIRRDFGAAYQSAELSHQERVEALIAKLFPPGRG